MPNPGKPKLAVDGWDLLTAIAERGPSWPEVFASQSTEALAEAVGRQIVIGNLIDGARLSEQGMAALREHRAEHPAGREASARPAERLRSALLPQQRQ